MTLWTMTDIAGTYKAVSHLIPFGTSRGFAYPTVTSHIFLEGGRRYIVGDRGQRTVRPLSLYLVLDEVVRPIPIAIRRSLMYLAIASYVQLHSTFLVYQEQA
jgi:hypothetical protein